MSDSPGAQLQLHLLQATSHPHTRLTKLSTEPLQLQVASGSSSQGAPISHACAVMRPCMGGAMTPMTGRGGARSRLGGAVSTGMQEDEGAAAAAGGALLPPMLLLSSVLQAPGLGQLPDQQHVRMVVQHGGGWRLHGVLEAQQVGWGWWCESCVDFCWLMPLPQGVTARVLTE